MNLLTEFLPLTLGLITGFFIKRIDPSYQIGLMILIGLLCVWINQEPLINWIGDTIIVYLAAYSLKAYTLLSFKFIKK